MQKVENAGFGKWRKTVGREVDVDEINSSRDTVYCFFQSNRDECQSDFILKFNLLRYYQAFNVMYHRS